MARVEIGRVIRQRSREARGSRSCQGITSEAEGEPVEPRERKRSYLRASTYAGAFVTCTDVPDRIGLAAEPNLAV